MTRRHYVAVVGETPKRDVDLFGPTTVRIDASREPDGPGAPVLYLSAYIDDPERFCQRVLAALRWIDDTQTTAARAGEVANNLSPEAAAPYAMPTFVEDVDWSETLFLPDDLTTADWKGWTEAFLHRVDLVTAARDLAVFEAANSFGLKACPYALRVRIGPALAKAYLETADQGLAA